MSQSDSSVSQESSQACFLEGSKFGSFLKLVKALEVTVSEGHSLEPLNVD